MTADEINAMPAGPEMDALVAERVMGWKWKNRPKGRWMNCAWCFSPDAVPSLDGELQGIVGPLQDCEAPLSKSWRDFVRLPRFSDEMSDAWKVVKAIQADTRFHFHLDSVPAGGWCVRIHDERAAARNEPQPKWESLVDGEDDVPVGICRAALLAVEGSNK